MEDRTCDTIEFSEEELKVMYAILSSFHTLNPPLWNVHSKVRKKISSKITVAELLALKVTVRNLFLGE